MGRIEDNEGDRIERARQEAQAAAKKLDTKRTDEARQFGVLVQKSHETKKESGKKENESQGQKDSANQKLLARRGIHGNQTSQSLRARGQQGNERTRRDALDREGARLTKKGALERKDVDAGRADNGGGAIRRTQGKGGADAQGQRERGKEGASASQESTQGREAFVQAMGQAVAPLAGLGTEIRGSAGAPSQLTAKEVVDEIVSRVRQGVDEHGLGLIEFDLKDNVLAGSRLTLHHTKDGIAIKFQTGDEEVAQLLSSSVTGQELARAMDRAKVKLNGLEVNGKKVL